MVQKASLFTVKILCIYLLNNSIWPSNLITGDFRWFTVFFKKNLPYNENPYSPHPCLCWVNEGRVKKIVLLDLPQGKDHTCCTLMPDRLLFACSAHQMSEKKMTSLLASVKQGGPTFQRWSMKQLSTQGQPDGGGVRIWHSFYLVKWLAIQSYPLHNNTHHFL